MDEKKIAWRHLENENAWVGVRGRFKFFTLRINTHEFMVSDLEAERRDFPYLLTHHMDSARPEHLVEMSLSKAQAHAERELDEWLAKAALTEPEALTPTQHKINSALGIVEACIEDGIRGLVTEYERQRFAERIALYCVLSILTELAMVKQVAQDKEISVADAIERRREELYEIMIELKERVV